MLSAMQHRAVIFLRLRTQAVCHRTASAIIAHGLPHELNRECEVRGGANPATNPRMRVRTKDAYQICHDMDYGSPDEFKRKEFFNDFIYRYDCADVGEVRLPDVESTQVCIAVLKASGQKTLSNADTKSYALLLPAVHDAVRMRAAIERGSANVVSGAFSAVEEAAFEGIDCR